MKIISIEPTPSPNTMKVNVDQELPAGKRNNYTKENIDEAPTYIRSILAIEGVKGVFHVMDFLAVERNGRFKWEEILPNVRKAFGEEVEQTNQNELSPTDSFGEVQAQVLTFKNIPVQLKLMTDSEEKRFALSDRFIHAMEAAQLEDENYVLMRKWKDLGIRYGELEFLGMEILAELDAAYPQSRLNELIEKATDPKNEQLKPVEKIKLTEDMLDDPDWRVRYQRLDQMIDPTLADLPVLEKALNDENASIRRLAVVYLGMIEDKRVLPLLYQGLHDKIVPVRRTAGDCMSDLGFVEAMDEMAKTLQDKSKIVRWRAAMFLFEVGDESVLPALKAAQDDPEFEVKLQINMAIERIEGGEEAKGSIWKQMTESRNREE